MGIHFQGEQRAAEEQSELDPSRHEDYDSDDPQGRPGKTGGSGSREGKYGARRSRCACSGRESAGSPENRSSGGACCACSGRKSAGSPESKLSDCMSEEDSQDPLSSRSAATPYIESSGAEIDAVFAGNLSANLKRVEEVFGVSLITRDSWIKVEADDPETVKRVKSFLEHLFRLHADMRTPLRQMDFDLALKSYSSGSPAELSSFFASKIRISRKRQEIVPRTRNQLAYVDAMNKHDIVFALGPAGTGKTYLAVAMAVNALMTGKRDRIILARPAVEAGENLGFLPGKLEDKINPYLRPLHDALREMIEPQELATLTERGMIELAPLAFMRGRTLNNSFIILDEAQNTTDDQMLMFLTRLGFNSQCVVAGDPSQTDLPSRKSSGLAKAIRLLSKIDGIRVCRFDRGDVMRHSLVERIVNAYEQAAHAPSEDSEG